MNARFGDHVARIEGLFEELDRQPRVPMVPSELPYGPAIYVFWEGETPLHVGRARKLRQRVRSHHTSNHNSASLVFKLTRNATGKTKATYKKEGSRADLMVDPTFSAEFTNQMLRLKKFEISFLPVDNPIDQYLLELYAALEYGTSLSEFDTS